jgi:hypothetical protein
MSRQREALDRRRRAAAWLAAAKSRNVVRRAVGYAAGVGALLIAINHGDPILVGRLDSVRVLKMALTVLVPYRVPTAPSESHATGIRRRSNSEKLRAGVHGRRTNDGRVSHRPGGVIG